MQSPRIDRASLEVPHTTEHVFAALADPARLVQWLPPQGMSGRVEQYDFRAGGRYRIVLTYDEGSAGKSSEHTDVSHGRFVAIEPNVRLSQTVEFESSDPAFAGEMLMTWTLQSRARGTLVTITAEHVPSGITRADHAEGMRSSLENLARYLSA